MSSEDVNAALLRAYESLTTHTDARILIIADESFNEVTAEHISKIPGVHILTNRFDISALCERRKLPSSFSDFNFNELNTTFDVCLYRVSKEKPVCHHIFNSMRDVLSPDGYFIVSGKKTEGIKSYHQKLVKSLGYRGSLKKDKDTYTAVLSCDPPSDALPRLDDKNYLELREVTVGDNRFFSKPGVYGWNKVDQGSVMLFETFIRLNAQHRWKIESAVDLGCGYGYLSSQLMNHLDPKNLNLKRLTATDNNAAAVHACQKNMQDHMNLHEMHIDVIADDCGKNLKQTFDLLLCNPPFHQGFESSRDLTHKFLSQASRLITSKGIGLFVVNAFIPLESLAKHYFADSEIVNQDKSFKVVKVSHG